MQMEGCCFHTKICHPFSIFGTAAREDTQKLVPPQRLTEVALTALRQQGQYHRGGCKQTQEA